RLIPRHPSSTLIPYTTLFRSEETLPDLAKNAISLGFDLKRLVADKKLFLDHVSISRAEISETGEYDLDGLFIRIADAVQRVGARSEEHTSELQSQSNLVCRLL